MPKRGPLPPMQVCVRTCITGGFIKRNDPEIADVRVVDKEKYIRVQKRTKWLCKAVGNAHYTASPLKDTDIFTGMRLAVKAARENNAGKVGVEDDRMEMFNKKMPMNKKGKKKKVQKPKKTKTSARRKTRVVDIKVPTMPDSKPEDTRTISMLSEPSPGREMPLWIHETDVDWLVTFLRNATCSDSEDGAESASPERYLRYDTAECLYVAKCTDSNGQVHKKEKRVEPSKGQDYQAAKDAVADRMRQWARSKIET